ncbi:hypothetical protein [Catenulispora yoronensis]|uniref:hypothetical protein n=1 Tax=Catenulispora yoronensis TaxID=450799 RepID=UPI0031CF3405
MGPLGGLNPIVGNPDHVAALGAWCYELAAELDGLSAALANILVDEFWSSDAGVEFGTLVTSISSRARQASYRFQHAADVYGRDVYHGYASDLDTAQREAKTQVSALTDPALMFNNPPGWTAEPASDAGKQLNLIVERLEAQGAAAAAKLTWFATNDGLADGSTPLPLGESEDEHFAATTDAALLRVLLNGGDPTSIPGAPDLSGAPDLNAKLAIIAKELANRQKDPAFLQDFMDQAADSLPGIARALSTSDHGTLVPFDPNAQSTLRLFASALAAAATGTNLTPSALAKLEAPADPWSMAMLLKYGPSGAAYGTGQGALLLAKLTQNAEHQLQPTGLTPSPEWPPELEPLNAILRRAAENGEAARIALGDGTPLAAELARHLLITQSLVHVTESRTLVDQEKWVRSDHGTTDGNAEAAFLLAAGIPPSRDGSDPYAIAAVLNVFSTASDLHIEHQSSTLIGPVKTALQAYTAVYVDDLAMSTSNYGRRQLGHGPPPWVATNGGDVTNILELAYGSDSHEWQQFRSGILNQAVDSIAAGSDKHMADAPFSDYIRLGKLNGIANDIESGWSRAGAMSADQAASTRLMLANAALGAFGNLSLDSVSHPSSLYSQPIAGGGAPLLEKLVPSWFGTHHLDTVNDQINADNKGSDTNLQVLVARALLKSGTMDPAAANELRSAMPETNGGDVVPFIGWSSKHFTDSAYSLYGDKLSTIYTNLQTQFDREQD